MRRKLLYALGALAVVLACAAAYLYHALTYRVEGFYFDSDGVSIHYTDEGAGEPVILLHGFAVNADLNWRRPGIIDKLTPDFRVIAMDLRGHGLSGKPHDPTQYGAAMAEDVVRLMDHLRVKKAHVVGYSLGGFVALKLAVLHPDRLLTVSPLGSGWEHPENSEFLDAMDEFAAALEAGKGIPPLSGRLGKDREKPTLLHTLWVRIMTRYFNDPQALVGVLRGLQDLAITEEEVRAVSLPVCIIIGSRDPMKPGAEALAERVKDHRMVVLDGMDHLRAPTRPEFIKTLRSFLIEHRRTGRPKRV